MYAPKDSRLCQTFEEEVRRGFDAARTQKSLEQSRGEPGLRERQVGQGGEGGEGREGEDGEDGGYGAIESGSDGTQATARHAEKARQNDSPSPSSQGSGVNPGDARDFSAPTANTSADILGASEFPERRMSARRKDTQTSIEGSQGTGPQTRSEFDEEELEAERKRLRVRSKYLEAKANRKINVYFQALDIVRQLEISTSESRIRFSVTYNTIFGEKMLLVGNCLELGNWNPQNGVSMTWTEGNVWTTQVAFSDAARSIEYKYVVVDATNPQTHLTWECNNNHKLDLTTADSNIIDAWGAG